MSQDFDLLLDLQYSDSLEEILSQAPEDDLAQTLPSKQRLHQWASLALSERKQGEVELTIRIVDESEGLSLNSEFRGKDYPTNVLSFPFEAPPGIPLPLLGDLVICARVVQQEALEQHKTTESHWAHMVIHGCLHLLGYDHINDQDAEQMESLEQDLMARLGFPDPYQFPLPIKNHDHE
jgi:probable rRNA maturation factor